MTNQNRAAQAIQEAERIAAADEYFKARAWLMDTNDNRRIFEAGFDRAYALLSQVRAPVADERAAFARAITGRDDLEPHQVENVIDANGSRWKTWQDRAALASAPVAGEQFKAAFPNGVLTAARFHELWESAGHNPNPDRTLLENLAWQVGKFAGLVAKEASAPVAGEAVYTLRVRGAIQAWTPTAAAFSIPDGEHQLFLSPAAPQASADAFDFVAHLALQAEFSARTFGPGARVAGVCDHIRKELIEVETSGGDLKEWVDVIILGLDGAWRSGATPQEIIAAIVAKQAKNEARTWPDWRTVDPNKAIEHQRTAAPCTCPSGDGSLRHPCPAHPEGGSHGPASVCR
ncbi:dATP/dGTP pyrophosphohydrolase domain-containing protein [Achromobacter xylosoxidans]